MSGSAQIDLLGAPDVGGARDEHDRYYTPPWCTRALMHYLGERLVGPIWEPAAGQCHIVDVLRDAGHRVIATDITPHESLDQTGDFLTRGSGEFARVEAVEWIVTNPPYVCDSGTATDFVRTALDLLHFHGVRGVAMLMRLSWLEPCAERWDIFDEYPPTDYVVLPRVNYIGAPSANNQTSVWYVWDRLAPSTCNVRHYPSEIRSPTFDWGRLP